MISTSSLLILKHECHFSECQNASLMLQLEHLQVEHWDIFIETCKDVIFFGLIYGITTFQTYYYETLRSVHMTIHFFFFWWILNVCWCSFLCLTDKLFPFSPFFFKNIRIYCKTLIKQILYLGNILQKLKKKSSWLWK